MFTEMSRDKALKKFLGGRRVVILTEFEGGSVGAENLSELLSEKDTRYLVDVPAAEDPDFSAAVSDMVRQDPEQTAETAANEGGGNLSKRERIMQEYDAGLKAGEISGKLGIPRGTVSYHVREGLKEREKPGEKPAGAKGINADRHLCQTCKYRAPGKKKKGCDYYLITDQERGCDPADCNRYEKGERLGEK